MTNRPKPKCQSSNNSKINVKNYPTFNITTVNVRTAKDDIQLQYLVSKFDLKKLDIVCLQEVHRIGNDTASISSLYSDTNYDVYWQGHKKFYREGVAICVKKVKYIHVLEVVASDNSRIMTMYVRIFGFVLKIVNIYAPTDSASRSLKVKFYKELGNVINGKIENVCEKKAKLVVCGDFNSRINVASYKSCLNYESTSRLQLEFSENGKFMLDMIVKFKLNTLNTFFQHKMVRRYTRIHPDKNKTNQIIDYIRTCDYLKKFATNCRGYRSTLPEMKNIRPSCSHIHISDSAQ